MASFRQVNAYETRKYLDFNFLSPFNSIDKNLTLPLSLHPFYNKDIISQNFLKLFF